MIATHCVRRRLAAMLVPLFALLGVLALGCVPALAVRGHVYEDSFGKAGSGPGEFTTPAGVAVNDATGDVYVIDKGDKRVERFSASGAYETEFNGSGENAWEGEAAPEGRIVPDGSIAVDNSCYLRKLSGAACTSADPSNGDVYVAAASNAKAKVAKAKLAVVDKYSADGAYLGQLSGFECAYGDPVEGVAVDLNGLVWVYGYEGREGALGATNFVSAMFDFTDGEPNAPIAIRTNKSGAPFTAPGLAVDSEDNLYVQGTDASGQKEYHISKLNSAGEPLIENIYPEGFTAGVAVDLATDEVYAGLETSPHAVTAIGEFSSTGVFAESFGAGHLSSATSFAYRGIAVNSASDYVYVADAPAGVVDVFAPEPPGSPTVAHESPLDVSSTSATLTAEIDPRGASTTYHFEYGRCGATLASCQSSPYEASVPVSDASVGAVDYADRTVSVHLQGLQVAVNYHFRVVAENHLGTQPGTGETFTTQPAGTSLILPDARQWELVSPPNKYGALIRPIGEQGIAQAAADGSAIAYDTAGSPETEPEGYASTFESQVLSRRGAAGWSSRDIATPHVEAVGQSVGQGGEYRAFSSDLSLAIVEPQGPFTPLVGETFPEATERTAYVRHDLTCESERSGCYESLVTGAEGYADVPAGTVFTGNPNDILGAAQFVGATPDLSHVVLKSSVALTEAPAVHGGLYEWSSQAPPTDRLALISVLPSGQASTEPVDLGDQNDDVRDAISADGSRVFWSEPLGSKHLYLRDLDAGEGGEALQIGTGAATFQFANSSGSRVFFTQAGKLEVCEVVKTGGVLSCQTSALAPEVQGSVIGGSEDGSAVYFVSTAVLGGQGQAGKDNLYFARSEGADWQAPQFVGALSPDDADDWSSYPKVMTAAASGNGRWLAFMSDRSLTGYDNHDAANADNLDEEVFLYDAETEKLECASCNPTGARPLGREYSELSDGLVGGDRVWKPTQWLAANIPGWTTYTLSAALFQSRYLSNDGRLFFNSDDALASQDINGQEDVYEYEPPGVGNCSAASATYSERSSGCVELISSGLASTESGFLDASEGGDDVFFLTGERLVPKDIDTAYDVYDAHVCTGESPCLSEPASLPECTTAEACRIAPSPQPSIFGAPPSATFSGMGNLAHTKVKQKAKTTGKRRKRLTRAQRRRRALKACKKRHSKRRRAACRRSVRKRYGAKASGGKAPRTGQHDRGGKR